jgi:hypothetical protein
VLEGSIIQRSFLGQTFRDRSGRGGAMPTAKQYDNTLLGIRTGSRGSTSAPSSRLGTRDDPALWDAMKPGGD